MTNFSLCWDAYKNNICSGLSALQQNGEFVDMTMAADGHYVKVHKMVMSLVSPYIKEIINSMDCQHPVIFLNKITYSTLCALLEYIYTGEVIIDKDSLPDLIQAARELCIKGLEDMKYELKSDGVSQAMRASTNKGHLLLKTDQNEPITQAMWVETNKGDYLLNTNECDKDQTSATENTLNDDQATDAEQAEDVWEMGEDIIDESQVMETKTSRKTSQKEKVLPSKTVHDTQIQYSVSTHGALQLVLNRYIYYLKYTSRKGSAGHRLWKCASYTRSMRCPATVVTQGGAVIKRTQAHNHPYHDKAILRKVRNNAIFGAMDENELQELVESKGKLKSSVAAQIKYSEDDME